MSTRKKMATRKGKTLLSRADWARAALDAIGEGGTSAVTIELLAARLGATRGSFYWHFRDRDELIREALQLWARESTTDRLPALEAIGDPLERLRILRRAVYEHPADAAELALSCAGDDSLVAPVFARVTKRRMSVLQRIFIDLGFTEDEAAERAWLAYAFYLGHHQLRKNPKMTPPGRLQLERMLGLLAAGAPRPNSHDAG
jgi:AcrR family transcriptional regulator